MKKLLFLFVLLCSTALSFAQVSVTRYSKKNGTYGLPYQRTAPNINLGSYSTVGNVNPYLKKGENQCGSGYSLNGTSTSEYVTKSCNSIPINIQKNIVKLNSFCGQHLIKKYSSKNNINN